MNFRIKITVLVTTLVVLLGMLIMNFITLSYLTDETSITRTYEMETLDVVATITGNVVVEAQQTSDVDNLAYIHYYDDLMCDKYSLLGNMATEIKIGLACNNNINTRAYVKIPEVEGLLFVVIRDTSPNSDINIRTNENNVLEWQYTNETSWVQIADFSSLAASFSTPATQTEVNNNNSNARTIINTYNNNFLRSLYEDETVAPNGTVDLRIIIWGDYYNLGATNATSKANYLQTNFTLAMNIIVFQAIDEYGGNVDYDEEPNY